MNQTSQRIRKSRTRIALKIATILVMLSTWLAAQTEPDYTLSKVKSFSGKYVFSNLEPVDDNTKAFFFENRVEEEATLEQRMAQSVKNAMVESGNQGGEPFDAIIIKDGESRSKAVKFKTQSDRNALAKIGNVHLGVYVFVDCLPSSPYDYIGTMNVKWHKDPSLKEKAYLELIERGKKKYPNFNGIIYKDDNYKTADLIRFKGSEMTGGGFRVGDKVLFGNSSRPEYGEIIQLDNVKQAATVKNLDKYGDERTTREPYVKLSPLSEEQFQKYLADDRKEIASHQFVLGEKVAWYDEDKLRYGEVNSLNAKSHDATIKYLSVYGENIVTTRDYLKLERVSEEQFTKVRELELVEIKKHQFERGEKITFFYEKTEKYGEVLDLNSQTHKATLQYLDVFAEPKSRSVNYLEINKATNEKYAEAIQKEKKEAEKYKFIVGEKLTWSRSGFLGVKQEQIPCEVLTLNDIEHKATVKYLSKDSTAKQETVSYLNLVKVLK